MIQITIVRIAGYGPWTLTRGSDREHELQMHQASLYGAVQKIFSKRGGLAFPNRFDEIFAVSNGISFRQHASMQDELAGMFDFKIAMSIGSAPSPFEANLKAHQALQEPPADSERLIYGHADDSADGATIMHMDVEDLTSRTKSLSPYEVSSLIFGLQARMAAFFQRSSSLSFFMGGDNFMIVAHERAKDAAARFIKEARQDGIVLNCGIGRGATARKAASRATAALDAIRDMRDSGKPKPDIYEMRE